MSSALRHQGGALIGVGLLSLHEDAKALRHRLLEISGDEALTGMPGLRSSLLDAELRINNAMADLRAAMILYEASEAD